MIRFNLLRLLDILEKQKGRKFTLKEVASRSGCDKNALSRMVNHPEVMPSASIIDKLVQFFFLERTAGARQPYLEKMEMQRVLSEFIGVYPDQDEYWSVLPAEVRDNPDSTSLDAIWAFYSRLQGGSAALDHEKVESGLRKKLQQTVKREQEIVIELSGEEFELLLTYLPQQLR